MGDTVTTESTDVLKVLTLASVGATFAEMESVLGRKLSNSERDKVRRVRVETRIDRAKKKQAGPRTSNERFAAFKDRHRSVPRGAVEGKKSVIAAREKKPAEWLKYYLPQSYTKDFQEPHKKIIDGALYAHSTRGRFVVAAERGIGKSTLLWGLVLMLAITGREKFPVCITWSAASANRALRFWKNALSFNTRLAEDYPEYCQPYSWAKGSGFRLAGAIWEDTGEPTGAMFNFSDNMIIFPDSRGAMGCETINGNPRGLNHACLDGTIIRPTIVLVDDPQSRAVARSPMQVNTVIETIDGDIAGLSAAGKGIPILLSGNCIMPDDVMEHYLNHSGWGSERIPKVSSWPDGFEDDQSECRLLWDEWNYLREAGERSRDGFEAALKYYKKNKRKMTKGMSVTNKHGLEERRKHPDALYAAMDTYYTMGHDSFHAECQQKPVRSSVLSVNITQELVLSRQNDRPPMTCANDSEIHVGVDVNYIGFSYCIMAVDYQSGTRHVVAHGLWPQGGDMIPKRSTTEVACTIIRKSIGVFVKDVLEQIVIRTDDGVGVKVRACVFDAGMGAWMSAIAFAIKQCRSPIQMIPLKGFSSKYYKPRVSDRRQGDGWHITTFPNVGSVLCVNVDKWRERAHRGFVVSSTEEGSISICKQASGIDNRRLAMELCSERLIEKVVTERGEYYNWTRTPNVPNDRADALVYATVIGATFGMGEHKVSRVRRVVKPQIQRVKV